jgi:WD40 repeat protein
LWDLHSCRCIGVLEGHTDRIFGVAISSDGWVGVSGSADKTVRVWDLRPQENGVQAHGCP